VAYLKAVPFLSQEEGILSQYTELATGWKFEDFCCSPQQRQEIFLSCRTSSRALRLIQPSFQWVRRNLFMKERRP